MAITRRCSYEDRDARLSILAKGYAHRPDTLMQTGKTKSLKLLADGASHTFSAGTGLHLL